MPELSEKLEEKLNKIMTSDRGSFRFMEPMKRQYHIPDWRTGCCLYQPWV